MSFNEIIKVGYTVASTKYAIRGFLHALGKSDLLSFDVETRSLYTPYEKEEAKKFLKDNSEINDLYRLAKLIKGSSGLSHPSIVRTTHFIFGTSKDKAHIIIAKDEATELMVWKEIAKFKAKLLIHNSLFDLRIMFNRLGLLSPEFIDTALLAKCYINHVDVWKCKTGLKELMGEYYTPAWTKFDNYEAKNLKDPKFLEYAAIDGAATYHLFELIQEMEEEQNAV